MADPLNEAYLAGAMDQQEQVSVANNSGAALAPNEVWFRANASGLYVAHVARETIAANATGENLVRGEISVAKKSGSTFNTDDDVYWRVGHNDAVARSEAKTGDRYLGECSKVAASGDARVRLFLNARKDAADTISVSSSISTSISSSSTSTSTSSSSSESKTSKSISSLSEASSESLSSNSDSVSSSSNSISSNA